MMVLLSLLAVGMLGLAGVSMRNSDRGEDMRIAQANARLALLMALGDLQKQLGPDQRVSIAADQRSSGGDGGQTSSNPLARQWTGVYDAWPAGSTDRPAPTFRRWLVSGDPGSLDDLVLADRAPANAIELVGKGTLGSTSSDGRVSVPSVRMQGTKGGPGRLAYWVADQNLKAAIGTEPPNKGSNLADIRGNLQGAPRNAVEFAQSGGAQVFDSDWYEETDPELLTSWSQTGFVANSPRAHLSLFHDFTPSSSGLITNVRSGGFRRDLSMQLERSVTSCPPTPLYQVSGENGINLRELCAYYKLSDELRFSGSATFTTGGRIASRSPYFLMESSPALCQNDDEFHFKMPVVVNYQMVFSFSVRQVSSGGSQVNRLHLVTDPIITLWNPLDVPVVIPQTSFLSVKYWQLPYDFIIRRANGTTVKCPLIASLSGGDSNYMTMNLGKVQQIVMKPGEVMKFSQSASTDVRPNFVRNVDARVGFNFGGGVARPLRTDASPSNTVDLAANEIITYEVRPNGYTAGASKTSGLNPIGSLGHTRHFSLTHHELYVGEDRDSNSLGFGGMFIDYDFGNRRLSPDELRDRLQAGTKNPSERLYANRLPEIFPPITFSQGRPLSVAEMQAAKAPFMVFSFSAKTETGTDTGTRFLSRFNPKVHHVDFYDLTARERAMLPYEVRVEPLTSWKNRSLEVSTNGNAFFGGGLNAQYGSSFVTTHSIPREPIVSLAALQHSMANGFEIFRPKQGYATLNAREPMLPQISHAIGNSLAPPVLAPDRTSGTISGSRPIADHSYLANQGLWDDWFFSSIAPRRAATGGSNQTQRVTAEKFFNGEEDLRIRRYRPNLDGEELNRLLGTFFTGATSSETAIREIASYLRVDGMFNVNSTSVEAWKAVLGGLKGREIIVGDDSGGERTLMDGEGLPVTNLITPRNVVAEGQGLNSVTDSAQWMGRRRLSDADVDSLARALVKEIRRRGPFLSLADFVNRRPGSDKELARAGALQEALDSDEVTINRGPNSASRSASANASAAFAFPEAEQGALSYGAPGVVKQADILTPIAPILSARSDTFLIRAYGESVDAAGTVRARAWCEAVVQRDRRFVDPSDKATEATVELTQVNQRFGRRFEIVSFRWLQAGEI
ncbi:MAG: hypothetical protein MUF31_06815 [Akkermansiaceae bacterium]|nr:hypothetical protein [Akkermansiaceae bacterium]